jgi:hypothetical protein
LRFPNDTQRHAIVGATGSGKTQAALYHLSGRSYDVQPWIIYDFKRDELIGEVLPQAQEIGVTSKVPDKPGIYIVHPHPAQSQEVDNQLWQIWEQENTGVYIDEGYMIGNNSPAFRALLTQGRSKHIPIITLSQRPTWIDRFILSESEFHQIFRLQHKKDLQTVNEFIPHDLRDENNDPIRLPDYHSWYYDVGANELIVCKPVPDVEKIRATFARRLPHKTEI